MKRLCASLICALLLLGCRGEMHNQPKRGAFKASAFFADGSAARTLPEGVVARGQLRTNVAYFEAMNGTNVVGDIPIPVNRETLERGRERFEIYCSVCHGFTGQGNGMIVQRGFPKPPSLHEDRLRNAPIGYFYWVISHGYGAMFPYAARVEPADRWAIAAYIRTLQLSEAVSVSELPAEARKTLQQ